MGEESKGKEGRGERGRKEKKKKMRGGEEEKGKGSNEKGIGAYKATKSPACQFRIHTEVGHSLCI